ncbi:MAG: DUF4920 domain-containing protein [Cryomorphaceae bacterium]|nr:DUF4920 domain-containing protein [Cryomorphaceae bacterium]
MTLKTLLLAAAATLIVSCGNNKEIEKDEEIVDTDTIALEVYGDSSMTMDGAIPASNLIAMLAENDSVQAKVTGEILGVCKKKGCWMDIDLGNGQNMTVRFKDYGFFVPLNADGRTATVNGIAKVDTQSVEWLKHKAFDAGKSQEEIDAINEPTVKVSFLADGVILE